MDYTERIQESVNYIEHYLTEGVSLPQIAERAGFSMTHFCRIFRAMTGESLGEYVRKRRLSRAAQDLLSTDRRILDIALDFQFDSQEVFTRAFAREFGLTPGRYRKSHSEVVLFEPVKIKERLRHRNDVRSWGTKIESKVVMRGAISFVGLEITTTLSANKAELVIPRFWRSHFGPRIKDIADIVSAHKLYAYERYNLHDDTLYHLACCEINDEAQVPPGMVLRVLPPQRYAVFRPERPLNPTEYDQLAEYAFAFWLPEHDLEPELDFTFDCYEQGEINGRRACVGMEVYVPIK